MLLADRYDLVELLGQGSFGRVFRAFDRVLRRTVAIKVLHRQDDDARRRFHREAVILHSQLANEFVVGLLDHTGLADPEPYLVLDLCELKSLRPWVGASRGWREIATALLHAAKGLAGLHAVGGLHRDIKPENLLLARVANSLGWRVKLADFGLAGFPHPVTGKMTRSAAGTDGYIAPEILAGGEFQPSADVYSLGVVGLELLVGRIDVAALPRSGAPTALTALVRSMVSGVSHARPTAQTVVQELETLTALAPAPVPISWQSCASPMPPRGERAGRASAKRATAAGVGTALLLGAVKWLTDNVGTYYDPAVARNRGPDGRFRPD